MDIQMPEMDGLSAAAAIRALPGEHGGSPIVAVTANAMVGDRERYLEAGFDDYLAKPLHLNQLEEVIARWTNGLAPDGAGEAPVTLDRRRTAQIKSTMSESDFAALAGRLPKEVDLQIARAGHAIRANDLDGVRVAFRALHDAAADFGLRELAALSAQIADDTADLDRAIECSATVQEAAARAKSAIDGLLAPAPDAKE
jgi:CheY-like chemotaxis protein